jgi:hypothetical protein
MEKGYLGNANGVIYIIIYPSLGSYDVMFVKLVSLPETFRGEEKVWEGRDEARLPASVEGLLPWAAMGRRTVDSNDAESQEPSESVQTRRDEDTRILFGVTVKDGPHRTPHSRWAAEGCSALL